MSRTVKNPAELESCFQPLTGSYRQADCQFLLTPLQAKFFSIQEKERLIQSGEKHYSEMISFESPPSEAYLALFRNMTERYKSRLAAEVMRLAHSIANTRPAPITLVSLARAGTPIGALLQRALSGHLQVDSRHYSISIIRDRGIDEQALAFLLREDQRPADGMVFVDAWTAKGVITEELKRSIARWNARHPEQLKDTLYVISDIGGVAGVAATYEDYVIPSGILNAPVSGLVSRSILNHQIQPGQFHGCVLYEHLRQYDVSHWFLDEVEAEMDAKMVAPLPSAPREQRYAQTRVYLDRWIKRYGVKNINHIKPGIAEATRVMLRRVPERLLLRDPEAEDIAHLLILAEEKGVIVEHQPNMPFNAVAFIKTIKTT
ncbi:conserved hypothetical protein [Nitrosococcus halophilus Nc 4]|uniref:Uncharacterized protein n=1 Tax=Nitrosococcus halophilus (strain Nc4) TaxID=472759 RepID=D5BYR2_NITHN|nr:cysteine protease StiP family protein [Nitrosococcus halophilus]ADE16050.1 conserved hypothetical protein [Nitrosococcus halophilus Nc 4]